MYGVEIFVEYVITKRPCRDLQAAYCYLIIFVRTEEALIGIMFGKPNNVNVLSYTHQWRCIYIKMRVMMNL